MTAKSWASATLNIPIEGVQFHPESILCEDGKLIIKNFLEGRRVMIREGIQKLIEGSNLTCDESGEIMREIMSGQATNAQIAAFLTALRMKGETVEELIAFASSDAGKLRPEYNPT